MTEVTLDLQSPIRHHGLMCVTATGFAALGAEEARRVVGAHPDLVGDAGTGDPVVAVLVAADEREMAALESAVTAAREAFRMQRESAGDIMRTLLPPERLAVGVGVVTQVHRDAGLRVALADEFGLLSGAEVAERAGSKASNARALASRWNTGGRIFAVPVGQAQRFPGFQFDEDGRPLPVIADVVAVLGSHLAAWELALWFIGSNSWLGDERPVDVLGDSATEVVYAATMLAAELSGDEAGAPRLVGREDGA